MPGNIQSATGSSSSMKLREESFAKALDAKAQAPALAAFLVSPRYKKRGYALSCHQKRRLSTLFRASARVDERRTALTALHICGGQKRLGLRVRDDEEDGEGDDAEDVGRRAQELRALAARERRASKHLPPTDSSDLEGTFIPVADLSRTIHPSNAHSLSREREHRSRGFPGHSKIVHSRAGGTPRLNPLSTPFRNSHSRGQVTRDMMRREVLISAHSNFVPTQYPCIVSLKCTQLCTTQCFA